MNRNKSEIKYMSRRSKIDFIKMYCDGFIMVGLGLGRFFTVGLELARCLVRGHGMLEEALRKRRPYNFLIIFNQFW